MISYSVIRRSEATDKIEDILRARGGQAVAADAAEVVLLAANTVQDLADAVGTLDGKVAKKTIAVGELPGVVAGRSEPGTLEDVLESSALLGILYWQRFSAAGIPGFVGQRDKAERLDAGIMKAFSTPHYGSWIHRPGTDVADFLRRVVDA